MMRTFMALALAAAVIMPVAANAGTQRHHVYHRGQMWSAADMRYHIGPSWRGPNQCFEDLGYGRYEAC
jgi:hypothetical protein